MCRKPVTRLAASVTGLWPRPTRRVAAVGGSGSKTAFMPNDPGFLVEAGVVVYLRLPCLGVVRTKRASYVGVIRCPA